MLKLLDFVDHALLLNLHIVSDRPSKREPDVVADLVKALVLPKILPVLKRKAFAAKVGLSNLDDVSSGQTVSDGLIVHGQLTVGSVARAGGKYTLHG